MTAVDRSESGEHIGAWGVVSHPPDLNTKGGVSTYSLVHTCHNYAYSNVI